jgi:hypothetical protein
LEEGEKGGERGVLTAKVAKSAKEDMGNPPSPRLRRASGRERTAKRRPKGAKGGRRV